jgi:hypothetical protein
MRRKLAYTDRRIACTNGTAYDLRIGSWVCFACDCQCAHPRLEEVALVAETVSWVIIRMLLVGEVAPTLFWRTDFGACVISALSAFPRVVFLQGLMEALAVPRAAGEGVVAVEKVVAWVDWVERSLVRRPLPLPWPSRWLPGIQAAPNAVLPAQLTDVVPDAV